jgi:hypothetical protein
MIALDSYLHCNVLKYISRRVLGVTAAILHVQGYLRSAQRELYVRWFLALFNKLRVQ